MKEILIAAAIAGMLVASAGAVEEKKFEIDPVHSSVTFRIRHLYSMFTGRFNRFSGTITGDIENPSSLKVVAEVDVSSVDTANADRDKHLRAADFFDVGVHPKATFVSRKVVLTGENEAEVHGTLTLRGIEKEVVLSARFSGYGPDHRGGARAGFYATTKIDKSEFGIAFNAELPNGITVLGNEVELILDLEAIEVRDTAKGVDEAKTLKQTIDEFKAGNKKERPESVKAALTRALEEIEAQGNIEGLSVGDRAPDFTLPDAAGEKVRLSDALKDGPVVLVFYRGEWCPFCNLQLRALEKAYPRIKESGASLLAIAPQTTDKSDLQSEKNTLTFPLLSDLSGGTMRDYHLLYRIPEEMKKVYLAQYGLDLEQYNGEGRWELPVTATYVIDKGGIIRAGLVDMDYTRRMEPSDIIAALEDLKNGTGKQ
jgi:polyisoprenoid-binding protein YceI/peroxiredoxin